MFLVATIFRIPNNRTSPISSPCGQPTSLTIVNYCVAVITYFKSMGPQLVKAVFTYFSPIISTSPNRILKMPSTRILGKYSVHKAIEGKVVDVEIEELAISLSINRNGEGFRLCKKAPFS
jgi:hypothetical protein